jgi:uncharacterized protein YyaL (SSP411 family)
MITLLLFRLLQPYTKLHLMKNGFIKKGPNDYAVTHFFDSKSGMFFYTHNKHSNLIARKMEVSDNVIPRPILKWPKNLFFLGLYFDNADTPKNQNRC